MARPLNILIVEDVAAEAEMTARLLRSGGLEFELHRIDTEAALRDALAREPVDLILADYSMPQFDGLRALQIANDRAAGTPFIFVTGTLGEERAIEAVHAGAADYVLKNNLARLVPVVKRALKEAELRIAKAAAERTLRDIIATSHDWIWQLDAEYRFTFSNQAVTRILGYHPEELLNRPFRDFLHEDDRVLAESLLPDPNNHSVTGVTTRWRSLKGGFRWLERNASILLDANGVCIGYRGSDRDVTERHVQEAGLRRLTRVHRMLSSVSSAIVRSRSREDLLREACRIAVDQGGYDRALIYLQRLDSSVLDAVASASAGSGSQSSIGVGLTARRSARALSAGTVLAGASIDLREVGAAGPFPSEQFLTHSSGSILLLPLLVDGTAMGLFALNAREQDIFDTAELSVLRELSANIGFALQYFQKDEAIEFLSYFDSATGLAKRTLFCERLTRALAKADPANPTAVVVFDVQRLSIVNDSYGRYVGDRLLAQIADRMKRQLVETEHLAHFGGGTFAVAMQATVDPDDTGHMAQSNAARFFAEPFHVDGHEVRPTIRSGIAYYPFDGESVDTVVQNAEAALKHAQMHGDKYVLYAQISSPGTSTRSAVEARLQNALARAEFVLFYQPQVDISSGQVESVEALLRWEDPETGLVPPATFIPLLESSGMIMDVGQWVLEQAVRDCQTWLNQGLPPMRVAVNVSPLQLRSRDFVDNVLQATRPLDRQVGIDLEITESTLMHDLALSSRKLERLRESGLGIAIDDFGTGYSSLRHLARLPVDTLKIDRSFIQGIIDNQHDRTIVSTVISLAQAFEMTTIAEGVETDAQLQALRSMKCDVAQGYLFCRPMPMQDLSDWLRRLKSA